MKVLPPQFVPIRFEGDKVVPLDKTGAAASGMGPEHWMSYAQVKATGKRFIFVIDPAEGKFVFDNSIDGETIRDDPLDVWGKFMPPPLPEGLLPGAIERFARSQGEVTGGDPAGFAMAALAACAGAIPQSVSLRVKRHEEWYESARIWVMLIGEPSTKKSPILNKVMAPIRDEERRSAAAYGAAKAAHEGLPEELRKNFPEPVRKRLTIGDITVEAAQKILADNPEGMLCFRDELAGWFGNIGKYSNDRGTSSDRSFWLESFNGKDFTADRVGRGEVYIKNLSLSIVGGIQPNVVVKILEADDDSGLLQRFFPVTLRPSTGDKDVPIPAGVEADYHALVIGLTRMRETSANVSLIFDEAAHVVRDEYFAKFERMTAVESVNPKLATHINKLNGLFARLCVIWHCAEHAGANPIPQTVTADTARRVGQFIISFTIPHALAFYGLTSAGNDDVERIADHIIANGLKSITPRQAQGGSRTGRALKSWEIVELFKKLQTLDWVTEIIEGQPRRDSVTAIVNPRVHQLFAERAIEERRRKDEAHLALRELGKKAA